MDRDLKHFDSQRKKMISTQFKLEAECKLLTVTLLVATAICACLTYALVKVSTRAGIRGPPGPYRSEILKFFKSWSGPSTSIKPLGPGLTGFAPWTPRKF